MNAEQVLVD